MQIAMLGAGYVGLVTGVCLAEFGHTVTCIDKQEARIQSLRLGKAPFFEPGLDSMIKHCSREGRLFFETEASGGLGAADVIFIAVGTPTLDGGREADLKFLFDAVREIAPLLNEHAIVVIKSTVPVGTNREVQQLFEALRPDAGISVVSSPEFLREGSAIDDFIRPDRIVIGAETPQAAAVMQRLYRPLAIRDTPVVITDFESAELAKYASNAFLAMKVTFINEIADLCEATGADVQSVATCMGLDARIGAKFLDPGPGYGGSCFPKDTRALLSVAEKANTDLTHVETTIQTNENRKKACIEKIRSAVGPLTGKCIGVLGVSFKPDTDDMREAPSLVILPALQAEGASLKAYDPQAMDNAAALMNNIEWCSSAMEALAETDAVLILTEWNEFRGMDLHAISDTMRGNTIIDLRNVFSLDEIAETGLAYQSVGRRSISP